MVKIKKTKKNSKTQVELNNIWKLTIKQWKWIASVYRQHKERSRMEHEIITLKHDWISENINADPGCEYVKYANCLFCKYSAEHYIKNENAISNCTDACPGRLIDSEFRCVNSEYHYISL